jgi:hypothetical protein
MQLLADVLIIRIYTVWMTYNRTTSSTITLHYSKLTNVAFPYKIRNFTILKKLRRNGTLVLDVCQKASLCRRISTRTTKETWRGDFSFLISALDGDWWCVSHYHFDPGQGAGGSRHGARESMLAQVTNKLQFSTMSPIRFWVMNDENIVQSCLILENQII